MPEEYFEYELSQLDEVAQQIWEKGKNWSVWSVKGEMGAGKTTLITAICKQAGVKDSISSPTYSLVNEYNYPEGKIFHSDWYRLADEQEAIASGMEEILYQKDAYALVEWAENALGLLRRAYIEINITFISPSKRRAYLSWPLGR